jgi:hypothetical protein
MCHQRVYEKINLYKKYFIGVKKCAYKIKIKKRCFMYLNIYFTIIIFINEKVMHIMYIQ